MTSFVRDASIKRIAMVCGALPALPQIAMDILSITRRPLDEIDIGELARKIETDPSLTGRILRIANSSYFGVVGKVTNLRQAIALIGLSDTTNSLYFHIVSKTLPVFKDIETFSCEKHWAHSWACATAAKTLAKPEYQVHAAMPGELYLAGLFHGVGRLALAICQRDQLAQALRLAEDQKIRLSEAEQEVMGFTDSELGYHILKKWEIPENIAMATRHYLAPEAAPAEYQKFAGLLQFAYTITNMSYIIDTGVDSERDLSATWIVQTGTTRLAREEVHQNVVLDILAQLKKKSLHIPALLPWLKATPFESSEQGEEPPSLIAPTPKRVKATNGDQGFWRGRLEKALSFARLLFHG